MQSAMVIESGPLKGQRLLLPEGKVVGIGRDQRCLIRLTDPMVSRVHCVLRQEKGQWQAQDQKSSNGSLVNGAAITTQPLSPGDVLQVGETLLSFSAAEEAIVGGRTVAGYRLERKLGRGAMGTVYLAQQISLDRPVALKILDPQLARDALFVKSFLEEARAAGRLNHPNVVQVYDAGRDGDVLYISMEYLEGGTVEDLIVKHGTLAPADAVEMAMDAAEALEFAERNQIVHRDIKPSNLLRTADGTVKIGDLGIAADLRQPGGSSLSGKVVGSPRYMAPEQARGEAVDQRADIYALGATLYRMLSGSSPHQGSSAKEIIAQKLERDPVPLKQLQPELPATLSQVVQTMLARDRERRHASAGDVREALARSLRQTLGGRGGNRRRLARHRSGSNSPALMAISTVVTLALVGAIVLVLRSRSPEATSSTGVNPTGKKDSTSRPPPPSLVMPPALSPPERAPASASREEERRAARELEASSLAAARALDSKVRELLAEGNLGSAASMLAVFLKANPEASDQVAGASEALDKAIDLVLSRAQITADSLAQAGSFAEALKSIDAVGATLPQQAAGRVVLLKERVFELERAKHLQAKIIAGAAPGVRAALALLDVAGATSILDAAATAAGSGADSAWLRAEVEKAGQAVARLQTALVPGKTQRLRLRETSLDKQKPTPLLYRIEAFSGRVLRLQATGKSTIVRESVLSLPPESLIELLGKPVATDVAEATRRQEAIEGLVLLVGSHSGLKPALAVAAGLPEDRRRALETTLGLHPEAWIEPRFEAVENLVSELETAVPNPATLEDGWSFVAREAAELILATQGLTEQAKRREKLKRIYEKARLTTLALAPAEEFFHAKTVKLDKAGGVKLTYDFSTAEQVNAFHPVGDAVKNPIQWVKQRKAITLTGEVRFLKGNPFQGRLAVRAAALATDAEAPCVAIGLWTNDRDVLTMALDGRGFNLERWRDGRGDQPADWFVLGLGYRLPFDLEDLVKENRGLGRLLIGLRTFLPAYMRESANVILAGKHGDSLHKDQGELIWESADDRLPRGAFKFTGEMDAAGKLEWTLNGKRLGYLESLRLDRLKEKSPHKGSFSILTNGHEVHYLTFEIEGSLHPDWIAGQAALVVKEELKALEGKTNGDGSSEAGSN